MTASVPSQELCRRAGITYRQLDHWVRQGWVKPVESATPGTGHERWFRFLELQRVAHVAKLMAALHCPPRYAFHLVAALERMVVDEATGESAPGWRPGDGSGGRWVTLRFGEVHVRVLLASSYLAQVLDASRRAQQRRSLAAVAG